MEGTPRDIALDWLLRIQQHPDNEALHRELAAWLAIDPEHVEAYRKAERLWQLTGLLQPSQNLSARVAQPPPRRPPRGRRLRRVLAGLVATGILLLTGPSLYTASQADFRTGLGEIRSLTLADGSRVTLDSGSAIAVDFVGTRRAVRLLAGQAFFEVARDRTRPFIVDARSLHVTVTGTAFNVSLRPAQWGVEVAQGSVQVSTPGHGQARRAALAAGERLRWDGSEAPPRIDFQPVVQMAAWRSNRLVARNERIADILDELRPYLRGGVVLRDDKLAEQRVTGVYDLHDPEAALRAVVQPYQGQVAAWTPWLRVIGRTRLDADERDK